jgi:exodeoxyribonuclease VII large subunit
MNVGELLAALNRVLDDHTPPQLQVEGVVTSWRFQKGWGSGDLCTYGPDAKITAKIPFGINRAGLPPDAIRNDMLIVVTGRLQTSAPWQPLRLQGETLRIIADTSTAAIGRNKLLQTLQADGRLHAQRALSLPTAANAIGLITAAGSAARADVFGTLAATKTAVRILEEHVAFTGTQATTQIVRAIKKLAEQPIDVIIITRGGGAKSDLEVFDGEAVADAIAQCPIPIITAIGHATDLSIADHVAHTNVATPTAAAVLITTGHQRQQQAARDQATVQHLRDASRQIDTARETAKRAVRQRRVMLVLLTLALAIAVLLGLFVLLT